MRPLFGMPRDPLQNMRDLLCQNVRQNNWSPRGRHLPLNTIPEDHDVSGLESAWITTVSSRLLSPASFQATDKVLPSASRATRSRAWETAFAEKWTAGRQNAPVCGISSDIPTFSAQGH